MNREEPAHIRQIVQAAVAAPSGDNSQPWRFVLRNPNVLEIHAHPEKDHPILNVDDSGTLIALGTAVENAILEAGALGYVAEVSFAAGEQGTWVATLQLTEGGHLSAEDQMLREAIPHRVSNRKPYAKRQLQAIDREVLIKEATSIPGMSCHLVEDPKVMAHVAADFTVMERIALSHEVLHRHFFSSIFWSHERNLRGDPGLHGKTLELPPPAQAFFRVLRHWPVARALARIGFPGFVAKTNAAQNASASAFGCILSDSLDPRSYMEAGRLLERLWLRAAASGMAFQVVTGILFLARHMEHDARTTTFSPEEEARSAKAYATIREAFSIGNSHPILTFRVGYGAPPTERSRRRHHPIEVVC